MILKILCKLDGVNYFRLVKEEIKVDSKYLSSVYNGLGTAVLIPKTYHLSKEGQKVNE